VAARAVARRPPLPSLAPHLFLFAHVCSSPRYTSPTHPPLPPLAPQNRCTPIYLGAADIAAFIPTPSAVIDYRALGGTPEALAAELARLNASPAAYEAHHAWRALPPGGWSPAFRRLVARGSMEHTQCQICRRAAMHRAQWKAKGGAGGVAVAAAAAAARPVAAAGAGASLAPAGAVQR